MSESNTEHTNEKLENLKQTILNSHTIFVEYHFEDQLYPIEELEKWKTKLKTMRSEANSQFENSQPLATRSNNDQLLHQVHKNIINKSSFSNLTDENSDCSTFDLPSETSKKSSSKYNFIDKTSAEKNRVKTNANNSKPINIDKTNNVQKSDQRKSLKVERSNRMNAKETDVIFTRSNATNNSANTNNTLLRLKRLDLQKKL